MYLVSSGDPDARREFVGRPRLDKDIGRPAQLEGRIRSERDVPAHAVVPEGSAEGVQCP